MADEAPPRRTLKQVRILLWVLVALAIVGSATLLLVTGRDAEAPPSEITQASFGGPFALTGGDGKPFSSAALNGKPYAIFFGFTRCGDVCPTTLSKLVKLRREAADDQAMNIVFVTIDPENDGPKEVGQYAQLFDANIIGLTGTEAQIDQVKKQYGIYAEPDPHGAPGQEMQHTGTVLLFDREGKLAATMSPEAPEAEALAKIKQALA